MGNGKSTQARAELNTGLHANESAIREMIYSYSAGNLQEAEQKARRLIMEFPATLVAYNVLGAAQSGQGKLKKAVTSYRQALKVNPDYVDAHFNLGNSYKAMGKLARAAASYRKAVQLQPDFAEAHVNLGILLKAMGKPGSAVSSYREALKFLPGHGETYVNLGNALMDLGKYGEAIAAFRQALKINPNHADGHYCLGNALQESGESEQAVAAYRAAVAIAPSHAEAHHNLGRALSDFGKPEEAAASLAQAVRINPEFAMAHHNLATVLMELDQFEGAIVAFEKALETDPGNADTHISLGTLYERFNNLDKAGEHTRRALTIIPGDPAALLTSALIQNREGDRASAIETLSQLTDRDAPDDVRAQIFSELGKLHDRDGACAEAFDCFAAANKVQARSAAAARYHKEAFLQEVQHHSDKMTPDLCRDWKQNPVRDPDETLAFIVGFPRSGTILLDQILDSHPALQVMEEQAALDHIVPHITATYGPYPESLAQLDAQAIGDLRARYFANVSGSLKRQPGTLLIDKYPLNIRHIPLIVWLFPDAPLILALRHPCDVVLSNFMQIYKINDAMANFFTLEDAAHCYAQVMGFWQKCTDFLPVNSHQVKYEALVGDFEGEVGRLLDFLGIGWDDAVLDHSQHAKSRGLINTPSYQSVTEPVYQRAKYRWKKYEKEMGPALGEIEPFIEAFGYSA